MAPTELTSAKSTFSTSNGAIKSLFDAKVSGVKVKLSHSHPSNGVSIDLDGGNWKLAYDVATKNIAAEAIFATKAGKVSVKQLVPKSQWYLVPSPKVELRTGVLSGEGVTDNIKVSYDFLDAVVAYEQIVRLKGPGLKARVAANTASGSRGAVLALTKKLKHTPGPMSSLTASHSANAGTALVAKAKVAGVKLKATGVAQTRKFDLTAGLKRKLVEGTELTVDAAWKWAPGAALARPTAALGLKYAF